MSKVELAKRLGISDSLVGRIERAEVHGSLRMSTIARVAGALESRFVYVVLPAGSLEDLVLRQAYHQALRELSLPQSTAADHDDNDDEDEALDPRTEEKLEVRTLELVDSRGLWSTRGRPDPSPEQPET